MRRFSPVAALLFFFAILVIGAASFILFEKGRASTTKTKTDQESLIARSIGPSDHVLGKLGAPVQLIVYADLSCPYCKTFFFNTLPALQAAYGDKIVVAYRHFPLSSHQGSAQEAAAAECAYQLRGDDAFWRFVKAIYATPSFENGLNSGTLAAIADNVGVPKNAFVSCVQSGVTKARVDKDTLEGAVAGIYETPSVVFKSSTRALIVQGNYPNQFKTAIQYLLDEASSTPLK